MIMEEEEMEMVWNTLPQDIHIVILAWLPAKSLLSSFKLVCKAWHNLIHDPDFVKMHLSRVGEAINGYGGRSLIRKPGTVLYQLHPPFNCDAFLDMEHQHLSSFAATVTKLDFDFDFKKLDLNLEFDIDFLEWSDSKLVGSCDGLLCLGINYDDNIFLLNPLTRKFKVSPKQLIQCPSQFIFDEDVTYGFGSIDDEYKVVRIAIFCSDDYRSFRFQIDLYSMSSNSWRSWRGDIPFKEIHYSPFGLFLNGYFHWIGAKLVDDPVYDTIVSFNIREEKFGLVPMPPCVADLVVVREQDGCAVVVDQDGGRRRYPYIAHCISLMNIRGCLGNVYFSAETQMMDIDLEIWVMKEYGIKESWTKEYVIRTSASELPRELYGFSIKELWSMTISLAGDQIIVEKILSFTEQFHSRAGMKPKKRYGRRILYDINKKKLDGDVIMEMNDFDLKYDQVDYIETLVLLKSSLQLPLSNNRKRKNCS